MVRHYWQGPSGKQACKNCKMKKVIKRVPARKVINGNKKVDKVFYQPKGGKLEQLDVPPPCDT